MKISQPQCVLRALTINVIIGVASASWASVQVDLNLYSTGSRATVGTTGSGGGLIWNPATGDWSDGQFSLDWVITQLGSDFTYKYTVKTPGAIAGGSSGAQLSHWILELSQFDSDGDPLKAYWQDVFNTPGLPGPGNYSDMGIGPVPADEVGLTGSQSGNPGMPNVDDGDASTNADKDDIFGVRFTRNEDVHTTMVTFTTPEVPVWGDFYAKDGGGTGTSAIYAYNAGFGTDPSIDATNFVNWIPRPDGLKLPPPGGGAPIPEPISVAVWSLLMGLAVVAKSRCGR